ncbi:MAG: hypothetical protein GTO45_10955 [Candidatus Aminicenantes bacterium]|nr:hypothetical protein [Candidatus Aminicenantes bacterium]NIM79335.1 hypothetical protein [Candidatus Aminicenantes bacterium]NIN18612.1 hypothetical protein [Candidatus Aminicenantes bacterium]NIN42501.1 hypothetical protein [Candidatus Aminicenantes bacterium]NIN85267.1 hypothetical protein [Candidatus Aminicenantes bacterium]
MKPRNGKEMLEKVSPPEMILSSSKANLRRKLLNSKHFNRKPLRRVFLKYALGIAPVLGIFLAAVISILTTGKMSAMERLEYLESTYHRSFVSGSVHYIKVLSSTAWNPDKSVILQQWRHGEDKLRIMLQNKNTGKILGHLIAKGEQFYLHLDETSNAKIRVKVNTSRENKLPCESKAYSMMMLPVENVPGRDKQKKMASVIISEDTLDILGFKAQDPAKIFTRLKSSPTVTYAGTEIEERTTGTGTPFQRRLEIFERRTSPEIRAFLLEYDKELEDNVDKVLEKLRESNANDLGNFLKEDGFKVEKIEVVETTKVDKDTGKISLITYRSYRQGQLVARHELTFLREQFLPYDPGLFDENLFQLEAYDFEKITKGN